MSHRMALPNPPGGELVCTPGQMPKAKIIGGQVYAECCTRPNGVAVAYEGVYTDEFKRWALSMIKEDRGYIEPRPRAISRGDERILEAGFYAFRDDQGRIVTVIFSLPPPVNDGQRGFDFR